MSTNFIHVSQVNLQLCVFSSMQCYYMCRFSLCPRYDSSLSTQRSLGLPFQNHIHLYPSHPLSHPLSSNRDQCVSYLSNFLKSIYLLKRIIKKVQNLQIGISSVQQNFLVGLSKFSLVSVVCSVLLQSNILHYRLSRICLRIYGIMALGCDGETKKPFNFIAKTTVQKIYYFTTFY